MKSFWLDGIFFFPQVDFLPVLLALAKMSPSLFFQSFDFV